MNPKCKALLAKKAFRSEAECGGNETAKTQAEGCSRTFRARHEAPKQGLDGLSFIPPLVFRALLFSGFGTFYQGLLRPVLHSSHEYVRLGNWPTGRTHIHQLGDLKA